MFKVGDMVKLTEKGINVYAEYYTVDKHYPVVGIDRGELRVYVDNGGGYLTVGAGHNKDIFEHANLILIGGE